MLAFKLVWYALVTSAAEPIMRSVPPSIHRAREHSASTWYIEWEQNRIVLPASLSPMMRSNDLRAKAPSPTDSASSITKMSGSTLVATAKASRMYMPLE